MFSNKKIKKGRVNNNRV